MKRGTLWIIGVSTALLTVIGLSASVGRHHWNKQRQFAKGEYHYNKSCDDETKKETVK